MGCGVIMNYNHILCHLQVSLSWNQDRAEPADSVSLSVSVSEPGSLVGVLVVDKATMDSNKDNGITEKKVIWSSRDYRSFTLIE